MNQTSTRSRAYFMLHIGGVILAVIFVLAILAGFGKAKAGYVDDRYPFLSNGYVDAAPTKASRRHSPPPAEMVALVTAAAWVAGVPANIANAVVNHESRYRANIRGRAGEYGLTQIKCQSARGIGFTGSCQQLADPQTNLTWGLKFLGIAIAKGGATCAGVSLHNIGIHARPRCTAYGRAVMARAKG